MLKKTVFWSIISRQKARKRMCISLSFLLPFFISLVSAIGLRVVPFSDKHSFATVDGKYYLNGCLSFGRLLKGQENWFYSFDGMSSNKWASISWGDISIGKMLSVFGNIDNIPSLFTFICIVNISICGLTMYLLLSAINGNKISNLIFSTSYALIGFNVVNVYQALFFIGPQMLPLVMLGLYRMMKGKSPLLYILSLALCIFVNFYFGFQICVFSIIYFLVYLYIHDDELSDKRKGLFARWAVSSVIAGLLAAPMWLPAIKAFTGGGRMNQTGIMEYSFEEKKPFIQIFSKLFSGANSLDEIVDGLPAIFCGILVVALVILFFMNRKIEKRHKNAIFVVLGIYLLAFYLPALNLLMHGGTHTNWFPFRYSYIISFLLICLAAEEFEYLEDITIKDTKKCGLYLLAGIIIIFSTKYEFVKGGAVILDLFLLLLMWAGFRMHKLKPEKAPMRTLSVLLILLVSINLYANFVMSVSAMKEWELDLDAYRNNTLVYGPMIDAVKNADNSFFRMEKDESESHSIGADPALYDYHGISASGPTIRAFVNEGLCKVGINWFDMRHWYSEGIPAAVDSLLGLKYCISEKDLNKEKGYIKKAVLGDKKLYLNPNALSIAILSNRDAMQVKTGDNVFTNLNMIWKKMTGGDINIFTKQKGIAFSMHNATDSITVTDDELAAFISKKTPETKKIDGLSDGKTSLNNDDDGKTNSDVYMKYRFVSTKTGPVYLFDTSIPSSNNGLRAPAIKYCGYYNKGDVVKGRINVNQELITQDILKNYCANLVFASADNTVLAKYAKELNSRDMELKVPHDNVLKGSFKVNDDQCILFTIPWDEGWSCYIDGKKAPVHKTWDLFMSVKVPKGSHTYEMKFIPAWLNYGLILFAAAFIGLIILMVFYKKEQKKDLATLTLDSPNVDRMDEEESEKE